eukprot:1722391-Pyramimonas_sp.AAC.1
MKLILVLVVAMPEDASLPSMVDRVSQPPLCPHRARVEAREGAGGDVPPQVLAGREPPPRVRRGLVLRAVVAHRHLIWSFR